MHNRGIKTRLRGPGRKFELLACVNGHERTPENTRRNTNGALVCMTCAKEHTRAWRQRRKQAEAS